MLILRRTRSAGARNGHNNLWATPLPQLTFENWRAYTKISNGKPVSVTFVNSLILSVLVIFYFLFLPFSEVHRVNSEFDNEQWIKKQ